VAAAVAGLGALMVGEYPFTGLMPYVTGVLFGLVVAEVILAVARRSSTLLALAAAALAAGGVAYAAWDDSGYGIRPIGLAAWIGVALAAVVAFVAIARTRPRR
jgi:hypothetical protein